MKKEINIREFKDAVSQNRSQLPIMYGFCIGKKKFRESNKKLNSSSQYYQTTEHLFRELLFKKFI